MFCPTCRRTFHAGTTHCLEDGAALVKRPPDAWIPVAPSGQMGAILGDRYALCGLLGKGSMARVYLADDLVKGEPVALKLLDNKAEAIALERFRREVKTTMELGHPNVVKVLDEGERADGTAYLVLELLLGEPLGQRLDREGSLGVREAVDVAIDVANALGAAHAAKVIHRDVKPDNIFLVGEPGRKSTVKVLDFGLAKLSEWNFTATGVAVGTADTMAPEQALTDRVTPRSDVYSLGVTLYRMLTGVYPFDDIEDIRLLAHHVLTTPVTPSRYRPDLPEDLDSIVLRMLKKRPENRYPSMAELIHDLARVARGEPIAAAPPLREPDVYEPEGPLAKMALPQLQRQLNATKR